MAAGNTAAALECYQRAVDVTPAMARQVGVRVFQARLSRLAACVTHVALRPDDGAGDRRPQGRGRRIPGGAVRGRRPGGRCATLCKMRGEVPADCMANGMRCCWRQAHWLCAGGGVATNMPNSEAPQPRQMAYLARRGDVGLVVTEDSDLLAYACPRCGARPVQPRYSGLIVCLALRTWAAMPWPCCPRPSVKRAAPAPPPPHGRVVFKLDRTGACEEVVSDEFSAIPGLPLASFTHDMFLQARAAPGLRRPKLSCPLLQTPCALPDLQCNLPSQGLSLPTPTPTTPTPPSVPPRCASCRAATSWRACRASACARPMDTSASTRALSRWAPVDTEGQVQGPRAPPIAAGCDAHHPGPVQRALLTAVHKTYLPPP
jgi:hypothetical protein